MSSKELFSNTGEHFTSHNYIGSAEKPK